MQRFFLPVLAAVLFAALSYAAEHPPFEKYTCEGDQFRVLVPAGWTRSGQAAPYADMTRVAGAKFDGPPTGEGVPASIAIYWYSGEKSFATPESYINARLGSLVREDAERGRTTREVQLAGRKAIAFQITTFELLWKQSLDPGKQEPDGPRVYERKTPSVKVSMNEQFIVLPASKGYFVLHFRAPANIVEQYQAIFDRVAVSFEPLTP